MQYILALDQGTTSSRAILFDRMGAVRAVAQREFEQNYPQPGWVEHDPEEIWSTPDGGRRRGRSRSAGATASDIAAIGITNQRETTVVWDREPASRSTTPSSGRTAAPPQLCDRLQRATGASRSLPRRDRPRARRLFLGHQGRVAARPRRRRRERGPKRGELAFGTIDTLAHLEADGRHGSHHRRHQRLADAALQHSRPAIGTTSCSTSSTFRGAMLPGGAVLERGLRRRPRATASAASIPDRRHRRRPAGGALRPGLLRRPGWPRTPTAPAASCS